VELLLENPPCKEGQPPDILLKSALRAEKTQNPFFLREAEFQQPADKAKLSRRLPAETRKGRVHFFTDFFHSKSDRLLEHRGASIRMKYGAEAGRFLQVRFRTEADFFPARVLASAAMWEGVVPQQPPMIRAPHAAIKAPISAKYSGEAS
jgi:hypothetical protein